MEEDGIHIGQAIKEMTEARGISVQQLADELCCTKANVHHIFRRPDVDTSILRKLTKRWDFDFSLLLNGCDKVTKHCVIVIETDEAKKEKLVADTQLIVRDWWYQDNRV